MDSMRNVMIGFLVLFVIVFLLCEPAKEYKTMEHATNIKAKKPSKKSNNKKSSDKKTKSVAVSSNTKKAIEQSGLSRDEVDQIIKKAIDEQSMNMSNIMSEEISQKMRILEDSLEENINTKNLHANEKLCLGENLNTCLTDIDIKKLQGIDVTKPQTYQTQKLQLGDKFLLSGIGDTQGNDEWLRLFNKDGTSYYGGFAAGKLWSGGDIYTQSKVCIGDVCVDKNDFNKIKNNNVGSVRYDSDAGYIKCATENGKCTLPISTDIFYGAQDKYAKLVAKGNVDCNNNVFGDPNPGMQKGCFIKK